MTDRLRQQNGGSIVRPAPSEGESPRQRSGLSPTRATNGMTIPVNESDAKAPTSDASADVARVLLDSTVLIDALRGRPAGEHLRALRRQGDEPWTSAISIEEDWRGLPHNQTPVTASSGTWSRLRQQHRPSCHKTPGVASAELAVGAVVVVLGGPSTFAARSCSPRSGCWSTTPSRTPPPGPSVLAEGQPPAHHSDCRSGGMRDSCGRATTGLGDYRCRCHRSRCGGLRPAPDCLEIDDMRGLKTSCRRCRGDMTDTTGQR